MKLVGGRGAVTDVLVSFPSLEQIPEITYTVNKFILVHNFKGLHHDWLVLLLWVCGKIVPHAKSMWQDKIAHFMARK